MWRLVGEELNTNLPGDRELPVINRSRVTQEEDFNQAPGGHFSIGDLRESDELRVTAQCSGPDGHMFISATLNGHSVVLPSLMLRCSFAMELWPYVAVCGSVRAVRLL